MKPMEELLAKYALNDGELRSLRLNANYTSVNDSLVRQASVEVLVRKRLAKKQTRTLSTTDSLY